jgi:type IV secretion system protein VirD4
MGKLSVLVAAALLMLVLGTYLSGYVTMLLIHADTRLLAFDTYMSYLRVLDSQNYLKFVGKIKIGGYLGYGVPALGYLFAARGAQPAAEETIHGDARFANARDLHKKGMLRQSGNGIVVGRYRGKLVRLHGQQFAILAAPTRSGKGVGVVVPNLLDYRESVVVLDIKQENFELTSGWRERDGHEVYLFNPFADDRRTHRWNPLTYVSTDPAFRVSDLMGIAAMLYPDGANDQRFWISQARNAFLAFSLYLFEAWEEEKRAGFPFLKVPTLGAVYRLSSGDGKSALKSHFESLAQRPFLSGNARLAFSNLLSQADETFASILGTFKEPLNPWLNPVLDAATSGDDFLLTDLRKKRITIYVGIQPDKLAESRLIVNLFFSQIINLNTRELPKNNPRLRYQCLLLMDEFTSIGRVDMIASAVAYMAGYNIRLLPIIQSMAQMDATYGKDVSRTIITNHALQIIYAPREQQDANDYSEMLGYTTVRRQNVTRGREVSRSETEERRALMLPQELKAMGFDKEVLLYEGLAHPVLCEKIKYYQDRYFTSRLLPKVGIRPWGLGLHSRADDEEPMRAGQAPLAQRR